MSSAKHSNGVEFSCDDCGEVIEPPRLGPPRLGRGSELRSFAESWELAKEQGWRAIKTTQGGRETWIHRCPNC